MSVALGMPSSADKRREQQRARRARAGAEKAGSGENVLVDAGGMPLPAPLTLQSQPNAEPPASDGPLQSSGAVNDGANALLEANEVADKIDRQFGEVATSAGLRAIAAVLYERRHGGIERQGER